MTAEARHPQWFSVRCIFRVSDDQYFEERVTAWLARDADDALRMAEAEAEEYGGIVGAEYLGLAQSYRMAGKPEHGIELFSLIRRSSLSPTDYVGTFFSNGDEIEQA